MQNPEQLSLPPPTLPSGGGAISGLKGDIAAAGPDGAATLNIPLPVSAGRGYAPSLALSYHGRAGNGPSGIGWGINLPAIRLRTSKGVPSYDGADEFTGPDGEVLVPVLTDGGARETRAATTLLGADLGGEFTVHAYRARTETTLTRLEFWVPEGDGGTDFWVAYEPDGQVHLMGRNAQARISNPEDASQTAVWLQESSVSLTGEQIYYQYRAEDDAGCEDAEKSAHPAATAQRYPAAVWYGNRKAARELPALSSAPVAGDWLFTLVFDYGERSTEPEAVPDWLMPGSGSWPCRQDAFSGWECGFEVRTRRLCRQLLMYHAVTALAGEEKAEDAPQLVARLWLDYDENPSLSTLKTVRQLAYGPDGTLKALPPLTLGWQQFTPPTSGSVEWQQREDMGRLNLLQPYQVVDLNGEGLAGILYQDGGAWWYRAPVRQSGDNTDAITWDKAVPLPSVPALRDGGLLTDLNGDGYLEWVVTTPGVAGHYDRTAEREWRRFTPLSALPVEYAHPRALLTDITGAGLTDLVLIGPKSVRFYGGNGDGWTKARTVIQSAGITLPVPGTDARVMVAFSDMAGSGQQHLIEVRADGVRYWPNLGRGRFGQPVSMPGLSQPVASFSPEQLYLADVDGSGTTDLIYALSDHLLVYRNQSGNSFAAPFSVSLPDGVRYDRTCSLQLADIQGLGVASLVLTVPHPVPQHWVCHLSADKPWLLNGMNNSMGADHALYYRSSAQFWLDEKAAAAAAGKTVPACYLPFALHTLCRTETTDEITGNRLVSTVRYRHGAWDGREREFRGFGYVEVSDTDTLVSRGSAQEISLPAVTRSWYATGLPTVDALLPDEYWRGDAAAFTGFTSRFTTGSGENEQVYAPDDNTSFWLNRGRKGMLLRSELCGADDSDQADVPYTVTETRPQVRLIQEKGSYPVVLATTAESRTYIYERVSSDPQCSQQISLASDEYGQPLQEVSISYPRRSQPAKSPYPDTLPDTLFAASYDDQQQALHLHLQQSSWHTLKDMAEGVWLPGLTDATRSDAFTHPATAVPAGGLSLERLQQSDGLLSESQSSVLAGQAQVWYLDAGNEATTGAPAFPPLQAFTEAAVLDEDVVTSLSGNISTDHLTEAGYSRTGYLFPRDGETDKKLWSVRQGYATYATAEHFRLPVALRETLLAGAVTVTRDAHDCVITQLKDAAGLTTTAEYDWRFLAPVRVTDANDNVQSVTFDALGRVTSLRFSGTENGVSAGYGEAAMDIPESAGGALALAAPLPVAQCLTYVTDSWTAEKDRMPPHVVTLTTDRYDGDVAQQIRQQVTFSDGFGRVLQAAARQADGEAWQRAEDGSPVAGTDGSPMVTETTFRWAVTGRTEYDNKGQIIRTYQPYFLDGWKYVSDDSARQDLYADTHYYDPVGREWQVVTAKGWLRRVLFTPWFVVSEDENDTVTEAGNAA
ncbi:SpvB/TcaC N-terminal domain-containing protein [Erwinia persicina]|uniref:Virulence protein n=1 Tax=Erwinia persicina TaxID=55211 RepID=A0ABR8ZZE3_9GAMM|nr:SpvB/TcaC N-terminal domain-containing protein [Erwinia persicina]MBD8109096.1 virulence protein [Erwinia persicina]MBD8212220.1 virulence protein [Erwinia persicina]